MQTEENLIVCFSDNNYDKCNPRKIELFFFDQWREKEIMVLHREICGYFQVG